MAVNDTVGRTVCSPEITLAKVGVAAGVKLRSLITPATSARPLDRIAPQPVDVVGSVQRAGAPFPVRIGVEVHAVPRRPVILAGELHGQPVRLGQGHMLDEAADRHGAGRGGRAQTCFVEPGRLPGEGPPVALQNGQ